MLLFADRTLSRCTVRTKVRPDAFELKINRPAAYCGTIHASLDENRRSITIFCLQIFMEKMLTLLRDQTKNKSTHQFRACIKDGMTIPVLCVLCQAGPPQACSHVIPRLVSRHIGKLAGSQRLRGTENINRIFQDTAKFPLLCLECEKKLGNWEQVFMQDHFSPYFEEKINEDYGNDFYKLLLSVAFRTMNYIAAGPERAKITDGMWRVIDEWRRYLHNGDALEYEGLYAIRHHELKLMPGWHATNTMAMHLGVFASDSHLEDARYFAFVQMGPFYLFADLGIISGNQKSIEPSWSPLEICQGGGTFKNTSRIPRSLQYIISEAESIYKSKLEGLTDMQRKKILAERKKVSEKQNSK